MSEFGKGFAYPLGLFLAHAERVHRDKKMYDMIGSAERGPEMWFYAAVDHLFELQIPDKFTPEKRKEIEDWQDECFKFRMPMGGYKLPTWEDVAKVLDYAKSLLLEWDLLCGIDAEKGEWE